MAKPIGLFKFSDYQISGVVMATVGNDIFEMSPENLYFSPEYIKPSFSSIRFADSIFFDTDKIIKLHHTENRLSINFGLMVSHNLIHHTFEYILVVLNPHGIIKLLRVKLPIAI
ncbi:MAG: hypothetical protein IPJ39_22005 [Saprospiraceae bacterium]|nr:hypothetical protein [Saprospiraceae bacterium]